MPSRSLSSDGCALVVLLPAEVAFGLVFAAALALNGHAWGAMVWLGGAAVVALAAAVFFFRDGFAVTGGGQLLAALFFLAVALGYR
ncbi:MULTISPECIES: hypothetical protein [unclassified Streptomyces]|uniref:hypothetical protein n=1 Tax=unclassified Streptomyces TaxID=2593676 RepID=UPI001154E7A2|nr:hypothetical protein [Streptomyces sp. SLBN-31]